MINVTNWSPKIDFSNHGFEHQTNMSNNSRPAPPPYSETISTTRQSNTIDDVPYDAPPPAYYSFSQADTVCQPGGADGINNPMTLGGSSVTSSREPVQAMCVHCRTVMVTKTATKNGQAVYGCMLLCLLFGCCCGCCLIPLCCGPYKDVVHFCSVCDTRLGICEAHSSQSRVHAV